MNILFIAAVLFIAPLLLVLGAMAAFYLIEGVAWLCGYHWHEQLGFSRRK